MKMLALNQETLQHSRYQVQRLTDCIAVLQHEWIQGALYMLAKHNTKFMQDGKYYNIQENRATKETNQSGKHIFSTLNRVLSSHPNVRAPIISGIIKIKALGEALFQEIHDTYASPETWQQARALLDACPQQHTLCKERYVHWTENAGLQQQGRQSTYTKFFCSFSSRLTVLLSIYIYPQTEESNLILVKTKSNAFFHRWV